MKEVKIQTTQEIKEALFKFDYKKAASILCPYEEKYNSGAFFRRIKKAKKIFKKFPLE
jgi:hypothetical protein